MEFDLLQAILLLLATDDGNIELLIENGEDIEFLEVFNL